MADSRNPNLGVLARASQPREEDWTRNLGKSALNLEVPRTSDWFTGLLPDNCPGFKDGSLHALEMPNLATCSQQQVLDYFNNGWTLTELLFASLVGDEPFYRPPYHGLRHPLVFYYVHPAVLYINKFRVAGLIDTSLDDYMESLFETGVDEMSWDDMSKNAMDWPLLDLCFEYRKRAYETIKKVISDHPGLDDGHKPINQEDQLWAVFLGLEHERIHLETSSVLMRELPEHLLCRPAHFPPLAPYKNETPPEPTPGVDYPTNNWINIEACHVTVGKPQDWPSYGWDNEYGSRSDSLPQFQATTFLVTNGEFWQFVTDGGYQNQDYWTPLGWRWRSFRNVKAPTFWVPFGPAGLNHFKLRTCFEVIPMQWDWPAVVNYHESIAFCNWYSQKNPTEKLQCRLLTEAEHQALRSKANVAEPANFSLRHGSERSVCWESQKNDIPHDVFGNVWQWCEDHFNALPGFKIHRFYDDFSTPCFDGEHQMIMGGSFISTGDEASTWARFHFRPHFFQHAGFRMVRSTGDGAVVHLSASPSMGASPEVLSSKLLSHYGSAYAQLPFEDGPQSAVNLPKRLKELLLSWSRRLDVSGRALDIGCTVGGTCFALAEHFQNVTGIDLNPEFIRAAGQIKQQGKLEYTVCDEGELDSHYIAEVPNAQLRDSVTFRQSDPCALPADFVNFDAVVLNNVLERLPSPMACLGRLAGGRGIVRQGGLLLVLSSFDWQEEITPREVWLGGFKDQSGKLVRSEESLTAILSADFVLLERLELPSIVRESSRRYNYNVLLATVWQRRPG